MLEAVKLSIIYEKLYSDSSSPIVNQQIKVCYSISRGPIGRIIGLIIFN